MINKIAFPLLVLSIFALVYFSFSRPEKTTVISPVPSSTPAIKKSLQIPVMVKTKPGIKSVIDPIIANSSQNYGVFIKNLNTNETYTLNEHQGFEAGSLYKLWVMSEVEREIKTSQLADDQVVSQYIPTLNYEFGIGPDEAEALSGSVTYKVSDAVNQMITVSDNYSAFLLTDVITPTNLALFTTNNGFVESQFGSTNTPLTTASDVELFFEKLYKGKLVGNPNDQKMIDILKNQQINDRIPKYLPGDIEVAHKTGDINNFTADAGIVYTKKANFIVVVLSEFDDPNEAYETISKISKAAYDYFTN